MSAASWQRVTPRVRAAAALLLGLLALWLFGAVLDLTLFLQSYLWAYLFWLNIAIGSLGLLLLHDMTGGRWMVGLRAWHAAAARSLPIMAVLFIPLALGMARLWPWVTEGAHAHGDSELSKEAYLNVPFFLVRALVYFAVWSLLAWRVAGRGRQGPSAGGMVAFVLTITFAAFDWGMSLEPHWFSTIYGLLFLTSQAVTAHSAAILASRWPRLRLGIEPEPGIRHDQGNLMLAFVTLWAYMTFSQWLIIWSGNLPEEVTWYLPRISGAWGFLAITLIVLHFGVPFFLLLNRPVKRKAGPLGAVAMLLIAMQILHMMWLIVPSLRLHVDWRDPLAWVVLGGAWIATSVWLLERESAGKEAVRGPG